MLRYIAQQSIQGFCDVSYPIREYILSVWIYCSLQQMLSFLLKKG